jgi:hypothetical protein
MKTGLSDEQTEHFLQRGHVTLRGAFDPEFARGWRERAWVRLGYQSDDPSTWVEQRIHMPNLESVPMQELAPEAWEAACALLGGEERIGGKPAMWGDGFIANLGIGADEPWQEPSAQSKGWHKDGDFFRHFLDSPEQGLLMIVLWSDIEPQGGGTFVACDSVPVVARFLAEHPEGVLPGGFNVRSLISQCHDFIEVTGQAGDVVLLHPYMLHAASQNHRGVGRFITNPGLYLNEPMNFNRDDAQQFSLVERAVLQGLGVERLDFQPQSPRERIVPERVKHQQKIIEEEKARLAAVA